MRAATKNSLGMTPTIIVTFFFTIITIGAVSCVRDQQCETLQENGQISQTENTNENVGSPTLDPTRKHSDALRLPDELKDWPAVPVPDPKNGDKTISPDDPACSSTVVHDVSTGKSGTILE